MMMPHFLRMRELGKTCPRCAQARAQVVASGLTLSEPYDHSELSEREGGFCAAQSVETFGPSTYGHPRAYAQVRRLSTSSLPTPTAQGSKS